MKIRYLGVAGWHFEVARHALLIDPYFTRLPLRQVLWGKAIPNVKLIREHIPPAEWIFASHAHYDHLMDVPEAARITGARVYASPQGCELLRVLGIEEKQVQVVCAGYRMTCGPFGVTVYPSGHRIIFGQVPYCGPLNKNLHLPLRARDYRMDCQYSFLIEVEDRRVLVASGIDQEPLVEAEVLIVGADADKAQLARILEGVRPHVVIPNHWDDLFRPLNASILPMRTPPKGLIPSQQRIDLNVFTRRIKEIAPEVEIVVPERFVDFPL